jgi:hypothetical protein
MPGWRRERREPEVADSVHGYRVRTERLRVRQELNPSLPGRMGSAKGYVCGQWEMGQGSIPANFEMGRHSGTTSEPI